VEDNKGKAVEHKMEDTPVVDDGKTPKVTCFNCGEFGHFSTDCREPRICFICQTANHVVRDYPEWLKPIAAAQYLGSALQGLGFFFHVEVQEEENRRGYMKFLDNYVVLTIEEGGDPYKGGCEQSENAV
jgi:hypothetical protein